MNKENTGERLAKIETTLEYLKKYQQEQSEANAAQHIELKELIGNFTQGADARYASKTTEIAVYGLVGLIVSAVIIALISGIHF
jgi:hypothetical protein